MKKQILSEELLRMKRLAGILSESQYTQKLNEAVEIDADYYELPDLEAKKEALNKMFSNGDIDKSYYSYFGYDSEEDLENGIKWDEVDSNRIIGAVQNATEEVFPESEGFKVEVGMYSGDEKCYISVSKGEDYLKFDLSVDI